MRSFVISVCVSKLRHVALQNGFDWCVAFAGKIICLKRT